MRNKWSKEFGNRALTSKVLSKQEVASDSESVSYETVSREYEERGEEGKTFIFHYLCSGSH